MAWWSIRARRPAWTRCWTAWRSEPRALLLTHIHLDHAGAAGHLARIYPSLQVYVHERGAPHVADPSKLWASATRLYGDDMERLWGSASRWTASGSTSWRGARRSRTPSR